MIESGQLKKGMCILFRGEPHLVIDKTFVSPGKGSAFTRAKLRNIKTGAVLEFTFKSGEKIEEAEVNTLEFQYLYQQGEEYFFMNPRNFEQISLSQDLIGNFYHFLKEGETYKIMLFENQPITLIPPLKVKLKVIETEAGAKGNTVTGATKPAKTETGYIVQVPLFIKEGDTIIVNTETGEYVSRI
ncbi:MAG: elongation factor P [Microgenomates group bacterium]